MTVEGGTVDGSDGHVQFVTFLTAKGSQPVLQWQQVPPVANHEAPMAEVRHPELEQKEIKSLGAGGVFKFDKQKDGKMVMAMVVKKNCKVTVGLARLAFGALFRCAQPSHTRAPAFEGCFATGTRAQGQRLSETATRILYLPPFPRRSPNKYHWRCSHILKNAKKHDIREWKRCFCEGLA